MKTWYRHHVFALNSALSQLRSGPGNFVFNVVVMSIVLALPLAGWTLLDNLRTISVGLGQHITPEISVFLTPNTSRQDALAMEAPLRALMAGNETTIRFIPREEALHQLKETQGLQDVLSTLADNPLPDAYVITLANPLHDPTLDSAPDSPLDELRLETLTTHLKSLPHVDTVQLDALWIQRLNAFMHLVHLASTFIAIILAIIVVAVIFNTIRLQVVTQSPDIVVAKLVGATDSTIHRPFYYAGMLLGLCAGLGALALVALGLPSLNKHLAALVHLYGSSFSITPLSPVMTTTFIAASTGLGLFGAFLSVRRHCAKIV